MGASLKEVKRRITSTQKTEQITGAMQMVSTAKLAQIQRHTASYQVYATKIRSVITHLAKSHLLDAVDAKQATTNQALKMLQQRPVKTMGVLVVTSDRGLVGSYNSNVIKQTLDLISSTHHSTDDVAIIAIGSTGADFFKKRGYNVAYEYRGVKDIPTFRQVRPIVSEIVSMYDKGVYDELYVCYNHFVNTLTSAFRAEQMLPITAANLGEDDLQQPNEAGVAPAYETEPSSDAILAEI